MRRFAFFNSGTRAMRRIANLLSFTIWMGTLCLWLIDQELAPAVSPPCSTATEAYRSAGGPHVTLNNLGDL